MKIKKISGLFTGLAVLTLITTTIIGGTMAYYSDFYETEKIARVAIADVTMNTDHDAYSNSYNADDTGTVAAGTATVVSDSDVVAPGTKGDFTLQFSGSTEIALKGNYETYFSISDYWLDDEDSFYCPLTIKFTDHINKTSGQDTVVEICGLDYSSKSEFVKAVKGQMKSSTIISAGADLTSYSPVTISWEWPFSNENDEDLLKDTKLMQRAKTEYAPKVTLGLSSTIAQID